MVRKGKKFRDNSSQLSGAYKIISKYRNIVVFGIIIVVAISLLLFIRPPPDEGRVTRGWYDYYRPPPSGTGWSIPSTETLIDRQKDGLMTAEKYEGIVIIPYATILCEAGLFLYGDIKDISYTIIFVFRVLVSSVTHVTIQSNLIYNKTIILHIGLSQEDVWLTLAYTSNITNLAEAYIYIYVSYATIQIDQLYLA